MKILRLRAVLELAGISRSQVYVLMKRGEFPRQVKLGGGARARAVGWVDDHVRAWVDSRKPAAGV